MSSQTAAYLRAADESNAAALALSRQLDANPRGVVTIDQTRQFITNTLAFRDSLSGIPFVGQASVDAQLVIAGLSALANDLGEQLMNPDVSIQSRIQNDYAEADTHRLRADLGLPTVGPACTYTSVM
jgi:hypothetical protein